MWLVGVVVRRYIDFLILLIPTPLVSGFFCSNIPTFCSFLTSARMRAARVTVVVLCVYVCVCVRSNLLPHTLESQKRDTNGFIAIRERFLKRRFL